jgi:hypothetical protein
MNDAKYIGMDVHQATISVAVRDSRGNLVMEAILETKAEMILRDGKTWALQVTDLTENTIQMRALMSAPDASRAFDLRCYVRELLVHFLQDKYPQCLPTKRGRLAISKEELAITS